MPSWRRAAAPRLINILDSLVPLVGTQDESDAIEHIYRAYLPVSFSRDILERSPERLAAMALTGVEWSDWGRPECIETVLLRRSPMRMRSEASNPDAAGEPDPVDPLPLAN
jgi:hypothetical protein